VENVAPPGCTKYRYYYHYYHHHYHYHYYHHHYHYHYYYYHHYYYYYYYYLLLLLLFVSDFLEVSGFNVNKQLLYSRVVLLDVPSQGYKAMKL
jgi:hypothetical protein